MLSYLIPCLVSPGDLAINANPSNVARFLDNITLSCSSRGGPDNVYEWVRNGMNITIGSQPELLISLVVAEDGGEYTCIVSNAAGIANTSLSLFVQPYVDIDPPPLQTILATVSETVMFYCVAFGFPLPTYRWNKVGDPGIVYRQQNLTFNNVSFDDVGMYECVATVTIDTVNYTVNASSGELIRKLDRSVYVRRYIGIIIRKELYITIIIRGCLAKMFFQRSTNNIYVTC